MDWIRRLVGWSRRQGRELAEELEAHRTMVEEELRRAGYPPSGALAESRRRLGNVVLAAERAREAWIPRWLSVCRQDLAYALRQFRRAPGFSAVVVGTLVLGIGGTTAAFSVVYGIVWRPLPYPAADRLVEVFEHSPTGGVFSRASGPNYLSWAATVERLDAVAAFRSDGVTMTDGTEPEYLGASLVTSSFFRVLAVPPVVGRMLEPGDDAPGAALVVVLGEPFWRASFGADPAVVGRAVTLDGERRVVVGVVPKVVREVGRSQAAGAGETDVFLPLPISLQDNRGSHTLRVIGRLRPEATREQARAELSAIAAELAQTFPATNANWSVGLEGLDETTLEPPVRRSLVLVLGAVLLVFVVGCANIANLLLARGIRRHAELTLRAALGAGRARLVRQLLTESAVFAVVGGCLGVGFAFLVHPLVVIALPSSLPRLDELHLDPSIVAFGVGLSGLSALAFGVVPALAASRLDLSQALTSAARVAGNPAGRWRQSLLVAQIALATVLTAGAGLLAQTFVRLQHVPLGFEPAGITTARLSLPSTRYADPGRTNRFYADLLDALRVSADVDVAAIGTSAPFGPGVRVALPLAAPGAEISSGPATDDRIAAEHVVSGSYFNVLRIPLLIGRSFEERDQLQSAPVTILSQAAASVRWPGANPIGRTLTRAGHQYEVIGVVGDIRGSDVRSLRGGGVDVPARAAVYFAASQLPQRTMSVLVRPRTSAGSALRALRSAMNRLDGALPLRQVEALDQGVAASVAPVRTTTMTAGIFSIGALLLMSIGIYGVLAFGVRQRTQEIGIRMSLGATASQVRLGVLRQVLPVLGLGLSAGLIGAVVLGLALSSVLFGTNPIDLPVYLAIVTVVAVTVMMAALLPAHRAATLDPIKALRHD